MSWLKLDDQMAEHRKTRRAIRAGGLAAFGLHTLALLHCSRYLTDGFIDEEFVEEAFDAAKTRPKDRKAIVQALIDGGQWVPCDDGWHLHDYLDHNPSRADVEAKRAEDRVKKSAAGKKGAAARWHKDDKPDGKSIAACHEPANGSPRHAGPDVPMAPSRPVPYPED